MVPAVDGVSMGLIELIDELGVCLPGNVADLGTGKALSSVRGDLGGGLGGRSSVLDFLVIMVLIGGSGGVLAGTDETTIGARLEGNNIDEARL